MLLLVLSVVGVGLLLAGRIVGGAIGDEVMRAAATLTLGTVLMTMLVLLFR